MIILETLMKLFDEANNVISRYIAFTLMSTYSAMVI